jgi:hypothetical protein
VEKFITGTNDFVNVKKDPLENAFRQSRPPGYNSTADIIRLEGPDPWKPPLIPDPECYDFSRFISAQLKLSSL